MNQIMLLLFWTCCLYVTSSKAQPSIPPELEIKLEGKTTFQDFRETVMSHYGERYRNATDSVVKRTHYSTMKKWNRYFWWNEHFVNGQGQIEPYKSRLFEELDKQRKTPVTDNRYQANAWQQIGPNYNIFDLTTGEGMGRFDVIAFHPTNANIIFAGSPHGGIFKTTNSGDTWYPISEYLPSLGVAAICVHPTNPNIIYVLSGDRNSSNDALVDAYKYRSESDGVYKTTNGGSTWFRVSPLPETSYRARDMVMDVNNPSTLLVATSKGIFKTTDGGSSWSTSFDNQNFWELKYKPGSSTIVYAAADDDIYRSTNGGDTFVSINPAGLSIADRISIAVTPAESSLVILLAGRHLEDDLDELVGIFKSTNNGETFSWIYGEVIEDEGLFNNYLDSDVLSGQSVYNNTIAISPTDPDVVVVGGLCIWGSDDGGESWTQETAYWAGSEAWGAEYIHPDQHQLAYHPNGTLYCANDGGIYMSSNDGDTWDFLEEGLTTTQFYHFEVYNDEDDIWGGTQDNGIQEQDNNDGGYYLYSGGDGYDVMTDHPWQVDDGESDDIYYTINSSIRSDNTDISISDEFEEFFGNLGMDPTDEDHIYVGYSQVYESDNAGDDWSLFSNRSAKWCLATCRSNSNRIYFAGPSGNASTITRMDGSTENSLTAALLDAGFIAGHKVTDIEVSPSNSDNVYLSSAGFEPGSKVFFSSNAGVSWSNISYNLPNVPVFSLVRDPSGGVYAGTHLGVYYKRSGVNYWEPFYNGLPPVPVTEMELHDYLAGSPINITISTFGRGIWRTNTYQLICPSTLSLTGSVDGFYYKDVTTQIQSIQTLIPSVGTVVKYNAGTEIRLLPGFHGKGPGIFQTFLTGCGGQIDHD